jgi:hypothetical protein
MRKFALPLLLAGLLVAAVFGLTRIARGQSSSGPGDSQVVRSEKQDANLREIYAPAGATAPEAPEIGFIDSPSATCYQPDPSQDACQINWYYLAVDASPNYMIAMTVTLNAIGPVARVSGFFQTSMYVPYNMMGNGFKVACGPLGAGGNPYLGNAYSYTINARDSSNLKSANYGTAFCPAYTP